MNNNSEHATTAEHEKIFWKPSLVGPFAARRSSNVGFEIVGGNSAVAVWAVGEDIATLIERLLNAAYHDDALN